MTVRTGEEQTMTQRLTCRVLGHYWAFGTEGDTVVWQCGRGCDDTSGARQYESAEKARRRAALLNGGAPRPPLGLLSALGGTVHREPKQRPDRGESG